MKHYIRALILSVLCMLVLPAAIIIGTAASASAQKADAGKVIEAVPDKGGEDTAGEEGDEEEKPTRLFSFDLGLNGSYSRGLTTKSLYYQPFVNFYLKHKYVKLTGGLSRYWNFQLSNGEGKYENVNFTEPKLALSIYPHKVLEIFGDYRYSGGDKSHYYRAHKITTGLNLDFDVVTLGCSVNFKKTEYHFKSDDLYSKATIIDNMKAFNVISILYNKGLYKFENLEQSKDIGVTPTFSWFMHKTTSLDLSYDHAENYFFPYNHDKGNVKYWNSKYYSNSGRIGVYSDPWDYISISVGVSAGADSEKYVIVTPDLGLTFNIMDYVKISGTYSPSYYKAPPAKIGNVEVSKKALQVYEVYALRSLVGITIAGRTKRNANPYVNLQNIAKSFWNQGVSFSVTYTY